MQTVAPIADITTAAWTPTPIWSRLDDGDSPNDSDYVEDEVGGDAFEVQLDEFKPPVADPLWIDVRLKAEASDHQAAAFQLWEGSTSQGTLLLPAMSGGYRSERLPWLVPLTVDDLRVSVAGGNAPDPAQDPTPILDLFDDTDGTNLYGGAHKIDYPKDKTWNVQFYKPGSGWQSTPWSGDDAEIQSNLCELTAAIDHRIDAVFEPNFAEGLIQVDVTVPSGVGATEVLVFFRYQDAQNFVALSYDPDSGDFGVIKSVGGSETFTAVSIPCGDVEIGTEFLLEFFYKSDTVWVTSPTKQAVAVNIGTSLYSKVGFGCRNNDGSGAETVKFDEFRFFPFSGLPDAIGLPTP